MRLLRAKTIPHLLISFVGSVLILGGTVVVPGLVEVIVAEPFVTGLNVKTGELEDEGEEEGGDCCWVTREEKTNGAFGIEAGAVLVPVSEANTKAGQQTLNLNFLILLPH